jgi:SAM-dependent methyltransferase
MEAIHGSFTDTIPENYERYLVPLAFDFTGADLARRVAARTGGPVEALEVACGTGISTQHLAAALPAGSKLVATDLNTAMVDFAARARGALPGVSYSVADALELPFVDESFDLVACQFGVALFLDRPRGMTEMARVLRPGGLLALNIWDGFDVNPAVGVINDVIKGFFDSDPPGFLDVPFGTIDEAAGRALFRGVGLTGIEIATVAECIAVPDYQRPARGFITGNPIILELRERATVDPEQVIAAALAALEDRFGPPPVDLPFQATVYLGRKPG